MLKFLKILKNILYIFLFCLLLFFLLSRGHTHKAEELEFGITFSPEQAERLGLDWKKTYFKIFNELGVRKIRISAYWDKIEKEEGVLTWEDLDWQIEKASAADAEIILAIGGRLPRWPECHFPDWAKNISKDEREIKILQYIEKVISRYSENKNIIAWQIENEPFLSHFGDCPTLDKKFLDQEISLVKSKDPRDIIITDSGELSFWIPAAKRADIFGTTLYRDTYSAHLKRYIHYPISPAFFRFKKNIANIFAHPKKWIVIELQAEPWAPIPFQDATQEVRDKTMSIEKFKEIIEFVQKTGFKEFYLWGVEFWYWEKEINNNSSFIEEAKKLF